MDISWLGNSAIRIQSGLTTVVSDPFYADGSTTMPTTTAQIVTISLDDPRHSNANGVKGDPRVLHGPGEYEIANFYISGMGTPYTPPPPTTRRMTKPRSARSTPSIPCAPRACAYAMPAPSSPP